MVRDRSPRSGRGGGLEASAFVRSATGLIGVTELDHTRHARRIKSAQAGRPPPAPPDPTRLFAGSRKEWLRLVNGREYNEWIAVRVRLPVDRLGSPAATPSSNE